MTYYKGLLNIKSDPNQLTIGKLIGTGGFKQVFEGTYAGEAVAVSVLNGTADLIKTSERKSKVLARELRAMNMLSKHPGVPKFYGYCSTTVNSDQEQIVLINELCGLGDLERFVETAKFRRMTMKDRMMLCVDVLRVLTVMHDEDVYHRKDLDNST